MTRIYPLGADNLVAQRKQSGKNTRLFDTNFQLLLITHSTHTQIIAEIESELNNQNSCSIQLRVITYRIAYVYIITLNLLVL